MRRPLIAAALLPAALASCATTGPAQPPACDITYAACRATWPGNLMPAPARAPAPTLTGAPQPGGNSGTTAPATAPGTGPGTGFVSPNPPAPSTPGAAGGGFTTPNPPAPTPPGTPGGGFTRG